MGGTRLQPKPRKCHKCGDPATKDFEDKLYCWDHYIEAKQESKQIHNKKYRRTQFIKKSFTVGASTVGVIAGMIVIYLFFTGKIS